MSVRKSPLYEHHADPLAALGRFGVGETPVEGTWCPDQLPGPAIVTDRRSLESHAQDELGDIVFVELPDEGETLAAGDPFATVESIKAISDIYAPVSGTVVATNDDVLDAPEAINEDPYGDGWLVDVDPDGDGSLLDASEYIEQIR